MIISASRRTDIPAYYSEWFFNRLKAGYVLVRNPMNIHKISKVSLSPKVVDGIVFWTKNPTPMLKRIPELEQYSYYFQFTLNPYGRDVELNVPSKGRVIIPAFRKLSKLIGRERVIWRYDPIIINKKYTIEYHCKYFRILASKLSEYTERCTISFVDLYRKTIRNVRPLGLEMLSMSQQFELMEVFSEIAEEFGLVLDTCAEKVDFGTLGISHAHCIDKHKFENLGKYILSIDKDSNQRSECGCFSSIDIGAYNTCMNGCLYCYANYNMELVKKNIIQYNPDSPMIFGDVLPDDVVVERKMKSCIDCQTTLYK
ncbi:DUF1848 domain-containing protein [Selenomonas ruminantium]|uniref:DUF1848 domain-containing protein n=1 Tax=Selenomonas ruminantium TaxID=971 RepID=UPI0026EE14F8|nr:DUF1848 domain-containing protein [Selenomonas ruminantium]